MKNFMNNFVYNKYLILAVFWVIVCLFSLKYGYRLFMILAIFMVAMNVAFWINMRKK